MPGDIGLRVSRWASAQLEVVAEISGSPEIAALSGSTLLEMRDRDRTTRSCRFYEASDSYVALNLARADDVSLLPALFGKPGVGPKGIGAEMARASAGAIVAQGRALGLAIAQLEDAPPCPASETIAFGLAATKSVDRPLVVDLSALWAGPLAAHLIGLGGASVIKVESPHRPDAMRGGDAALFTRLNGNKAHKLLDIRTDWGRDALIALIHFADVVIEAARPRALIQLGIDADALVAEIPGLVWLTITGHGVRGEAANWIGYGDDCGVAGGLSAALLKTTGKIGFVGDAIADPLTGIYAARVALEQRKRGFGARLALSMSGVVAQALAETEAPLVSC